MIGLDFQVKKFGVFSANISLAKSTPKNFEIVGTPACLAISAVFSGGSTFNTETPNFWNWERRYHSDYIWIHKNEFVGYIDYFAIFFV